jgi:soluble lytic murein transglycosylase-like protein
MCNKRTTLSAVLTGSALLAAAGPAQASVPHTVTEAETLWSIAAAHGLPTSSVAAANGLSADAQVILGSTIDIPSAGEAGVAPASSAAPAGTGAPGPLGAYRVAWGDTLAGIAARSGISTERLAWMNGLDPAGVLVAGTPLKLPTGAPTASTASSTPPAPAPQAVPAAAPNPTGEFVSSSQVGQIASSHGVSPSLAAAIAHQESGFNNSMVSSANARGVMQITPGTWDFVQGQLATRQLNPSSAGDNVEAGVTYLGQLLRDTGGDEATATAAYYQGLSSVQRVGMLPETRRYVAAVMAQRANYGGP